MNIILIFKHVFIYLYIYSKSHLVFSTPTDPNSANPTPASQNGTASGQTLVEVDLDKKESTTQIKYKRIEAENADIFYANDGYLIKRVVVNYTDENGEAQVFEAWKPKTAGKYAKKVSYIVTEGKPTLKIAYPDDADAFDPDSPPSSTAPTPISLSASAAPAAPAPTQTATAPDAGAVAAQGSVEAITPTQPVAEPSVAPVSAHVPGASVAPLASQYVGSTESIEAISSTTPLDSSQYTDSISLSGQTSGVAGVVPDSTFSSVASALGGSVGISGSSGSSYQIKTDSDGNNYAEFSLDSDDEEDNDQFDAEEIHATPTSTQSKTFAFSGSKFSLNQFVSRLDRRVSNIEDRFDSIEDKVSMLFTIVNYQQMLMEVKSAFLGKPSPFERPGAPSSFLAASSAFKPTTKVTSRVLSPEEYPSDVKLYILDPTNSNSLIELLSNYFKISREGEELIYEFTSDVKIELVLFKGKTAFNHRDGDIYPLKVVFDPSQERILFDFIDSVVIYMRKDSQASRECYQCAHPASEDITLTGHGQDTTEEDRVEDSTAPETTPTSVSGTSESINLGSSDQVTESINLGGTVGESTDSISLGASGTDSGESEAISLGATAGESIESISLGGQGTSESISLGATTNGSTESISLGGSTSITDADSSSSLSTGASEGAASAPVSGPSMPAD